MQRSNERLSRTNYQDFNRLKSLKLPTEVIIELTPTQRDRVAFIITNQLVILGLPQQDSNFQQIHHTLTTQTIDNLSHRKPSMGKLSDQILLAETHISLASACALLAICVVAKDLQLYLKARIPFNPQQVPTVIAETQQMLSFDMMLSTYWQLPLNTFPAGIRNSASPASTAVKWRNFFTDFFCEGDKLVVLDTIIQYSDFQLPKLNVKISPKPLPVHRSPASVLTSSQEVVLPPVAQETVPESDFSSSERQKEFTYYRQEIQNLLRTEGFDLNSVPVREIEEEIFFELASRSEQLKGMEKTEFEKVLFSVSISITMHAVIKELHVYFLSISKRFDGFTDEDVHDAIADVRNKLISRRLPPEKDSRIKEETYKNMEHSIWPGIVTGFSSGEFTKGFPRNNFKYVLEMFKRCMLDISRSHTARSRYEVTTEVSEGERTPEGRQLSFAQVVFDSTSIEEEDDINELNLIMLELVEKIIPTLSTTQKQLLPFIFTTYSMEELRVASGIDHPITVRTARHKLRRKIQDMLLQNYPDLYARLKNQSVKSTAE